MPKPLNTALSIARNRYLSGALAATLTLALLIGTSFPQVTNAADKPASVFACMEGPSTAACLLDIAQRESQRITQPAPRHQAYAKLINAAAVAGLPRPASLEAGLRVLSDTAMDERNRLDLLIAVSNYRQSFESAENKERIPALALYYHLSETLEGSARLGLMLLACSIGDWPVEMAEAWNAIAEHGCTPGFLEETPLPRETDRLMSVLLAPVVFTREDEFESFEAAIDKAHAMARDMDRQMEGKPDDARAAWQQLKAGMYLLHGESFALAGDLLRARLSAAASYAAVLAGEELMGHMLAEERVGVAGLLLRAGQQQTAEKIVEETAQKIDADLQRQHVPASARVGFLTAIIEVIGGEPPESLTCPAPADEANPEI